MLSTIWSTTTMEKRLSNHLLNPNGTQDHNKFKDGVTCTIPAILSTIEGVITSRLIVDGPFVPLTDDVFGLPCSIYPSAVSRLFRHNGRTKVFIFFPKGVLHGEQECKDVVTVTEHSRLLLNKCGQVEEPLVIESSSDEINITLSVKSQFIPKRGLMAYFTGRLLLLLLFNI